MTTQRNYQSQLLRLLPPGFAWTQNANTNLGRLLQGFADELCRIEERAKTIVNVEAFPTTATELLSEWESFLGLPGACDTLAPALEQRRADVVSKLVNRVGQSPAYFLELAASLGFQVSQLIEYRAFEVGRSVVGDLLSNEDWVFTWTVQASSLSPAFFSAGSSGAGDALVAADNSRLTCVFEQLKPAHTTVTFSFTDTYVGYAPWETLAPDPIDFSIDSPSVLIL